MEICAFISGLVFMLLTVTATEANLERYTFLPGCRDLTDSRSKSSNLIQLRSSEGDPNSIQTSTYVLSGNVELVASKYLCENIVEDIIETSSIQSTSFGTNPKILDVHRRNEKFFTKDGQYFDGNFYYDPIYHAFCVKSVSDTSISVQVCKPSCNSSESQAYCVPKCCAPDEIVGYWAGHCRKLKSVEPRWTPKLSGKIRLHGNQVAIYQRNELACENGIKRLPFRNVEGLKMPNAPPSENKENVKLEVRDGKVRLLHLAEDRQWKDLNERFCVDGFVSSQTATYNNDENDNQVAVICPENAADVGKMYQTFTEAWIYVVISIIASLFLVAIVVVYLILPEKRNFHGLVVLSYTISTLFSYLLYTSAHFVTLYPNEEFTGIGKRGPICMIIAIGSHYFLFTSFAWLTVMNIDLWRTFSSLHMISQTDKRLKDFTLYSIAAWGIPLLLIISFVTVDEIFRDPLTQEIVPDYATTSCSVASWSRGYYVYAPLANILVINALLTTLTFCVLFRARMNASKLASNGPERYSMTLFFKLFCITGVVWFFQMLSWYYNGENKPVIFLGIDIIMHLQAVALFCLFCCNDRALQKLQDEYPRCSRLVNGIRRIENIICCQSKFGQGKMEPETKPLFATPSKATQSTVAE